MKLLRKVTDYLPLRKGMRILEVGGKKESIGSYMNQEEIEFDRVDKIKGLNKDYDFVIVPDLFNHLTKNEAFQFLDELLGITKENVFLLLNEGALSIPNFVGYDISYFYLEEFECYLIKIYKQSKSVARRPYSLIEKTPTQSLKILYVMSTTYLTGGLKMLYEQMKSLQKRGHWIKVIIKGDYDFVVPNWVEDFVPDEEIIMDQNDQYTHYLDGIDLVIVDFYFLVSELENQKVPVFYWEQGHEYLFGDVKDKDAEVGVRSYIEQGFKRNFYLATVSEYVHDTVKMRFNKESFVLPVSIDTAFYYPLEQKEDRELLTILLVGNPFYTFKGFKKALQVLKNVWNQGYRFRLEWACHFKPTTAELPFEITFHENVSQSELAIVYRQADILLACSLYEGFLMPPLEAMASGVAVVATDSGGINQYATHGENALIAVSNTVDELVEWLKVALTDEVKRKSLVKKGYQTALSLNYENGSALLEKILFSVVADFEMKQSSYDQARRLMDEGRYSEAIAYFNKFLDDGMGWSEDMIAACFYLSHCYIALGMTDKILPTLYKSFEYDTPRPEVCCQIGYYYKGLEDYKKAIFWFELALTLTKNSKGFTLNDYRDYIPSVELCLCYHLLGNVEKAYQYHKMSKNYKPNDHVVIYNEAYFKGIGLTN